jgi:hypothetical protein
VNKSALKNFAVRARKRLIEEVTQKAYEAGITKDKIHDIETFEGGFKIKGRENGKVFKKYETKQREKLLEKINEKGFDQVMEEVAYTWFNRFIALRFMEINNYLPTEVRVLSSLQPGKKEPDIIREALNIDLDVDREIVFRLQDSGDTEDLYKYLLIRQCNQLGEIMPAVFEQIEDYTELLLPDNLLAEGSVIRDLVDSIDEYDWKIELSDAERELEAEKGEHGIEIIGWLYQYYISEKKDEVFAGLKKNIKITKENIPAATQLFTPKWIVKYMVENSLGRLWLESHPDKDLQAKWKYYLEEAEQEPEVQKQLEELKNPNLNPEEIKILDPAMGSGHILVYAFDVLYDIYLRAGYPERQIPGLILEKNLYGLEIDDRAGQLASFALLMKARSKNRRIFRHAPRLNLCSIQESNGISRKAVDYLVDSKETGIVEYMRREEVEYLIDVFHDAKEYGSILEVKEIDFDALEQRVEEIRKTAPEDIFEYMYLDREVILEKLPPLIKQGRIMSQKYDVVCTNPPYMGRRNMNSKLANKLEKNYKDSSSDLFAVFMEMDRHLLKKQGFLSMINQHSWMFLSSFEKLREKIITNRTLYNLIHLGPHAFEEIGGEVVQSAAFSIRKIRISNYLCDYIRLVKWDNAKIKKIKAIKSFEDPKVSYRYSSITANFKKIPGSPIAYWAGDNIFKWFKEYEAIGKKVEFRKGMGTGNNERFVRCWYEVDFNLIGFDFSSSKEAQVSKKKWFPYNNGGPFRKWYGNNNDVTNWENDGKEVKKNATLLNNGGHWSRYIASTSKFFYPGITWTAISSDRFSVRYFGKGYLFSSASMCGFGSDKDLLIIGALLNSNTSKIFLDIVSPTLNYGPRQIKKIPFSNKGYEVNLDIIKQNVKMSKTDWDSFETSWDFQKHPLLTNKNNATSIEQAYNNWSYFTEAQFNQLKQNEEELNRIFIEIYGLQDELTPEVEDKDITIRKADREREIKSFISYGVGCMFGRYSLDKEGLIYAGGDFNKQFRLENGTWQINTGDAWIPSSIEIAKNNIIPIADGDYFKDDILERFIAFVKTSFGAETLEENLNFIAETLGMKTTETPRQAIRRYFLKDFYKDHVRIYKKRPIYWLFDSGKENGFKALIYLHRYDPFTVARVRADYLHKQQKKYEGEINHLDILMDSNISDREKAKARKRKEQILKQLKECRIYDQAIAHVANRKIDLDLDDGVKVNYAKFQAVEIPQEAGKKPLKADLLAKI